MPLPGCEVPLKAKANKPLSIWKLEWTYSDGSGTPVLDTAQSDQDPRIATPVADGGTGLTSVAFPKCTRVWVQHVGFEPASAGAGTASNYRQTYVTARSASAGTLTVDLLAANGGSFSDPASGSRVRLELLLEY